MESGDIPRFMAGYVRDEGLRFASGGSVRRGWQETLQRYQTHYDSREKMGMLTFRDLEFLVLIEEHAEVFGRFELKRSDSAGNATGLFVLLMKREGDCWLVRHDHTSSKNSHDCDSQEGDSQNPFSPDRPSDECRHWHCGLSDLLFRPSIALDPHPLAMLRHRSG